MIPHGPFSLDELIRECSLELERRRVEYPKLVASGRVDRVLANRRQARMLDIRMRLEWQRDNEAVLEAAWEIARREATRSPTLARIMAALPAGTEIKSIRTLK
jgi:hypothetical protein